MPVRPEPVEGLGAGLRQAQPERDVIDNLCSTNRINDWYTVLVERFTGCTIRASFAM